MISNLPSSGVKGALKLAFWRLQIAVFFILTKLTLLDDHVVDVLLDSAAMGMNIVEREGISFTHPARFILVGTMNPEEGELRPQLLDRFALSVDIHGIRTARERVQIMERNLAFEQDAETFRQEWLPREEELSHKIEKARKIIDQVKHYERNLLAIASFTASLNVDGHRSDLVILKASRAHAALEGRTSINDMDIAIAAEFALPHRMKGGPMQQNEMGVEQISQQIEQLVGSQGEDNQPLEKEKTKEESEAPKKV